MYASEEAAQPGALTTEDEAMDVDERGVEVAAEAEASTSALTGSGGYLEHVFRQAAWELHGVRVTAPISYTTLRNADFKEAALEVDGRVVLRVAAVYGFRNIQNLLRKIKLRKSEYHYVEIMACPSGCLNGGGQLKPDQGGTARTAKQLLEEVERAYYRAEVGRAPVDNPQVHQVYSQLLRGGCFSPQARELLHTHYHKREKTVAMMINNW